MNNFPFSREPIYAALFALVDGAATSAVTPAQTVSRVTKHYTQSGPMPAVYQLQKGELATRKRGFPAKFLFKVELLLYTQGSADGLTPASTAINNIVDAVEAALAPAPGPGTNNQTLGGLVEHCWIEGAIETYEAILVQTSITIVPIHILVTGN